MAQTDEAQTAPTARRARGEARPWSPPTRPRGEALVCPWCGRSVYAPAAPCSEIDSAALAAMLREPDASARCAWEARTRGVTVALF